MRSLRKNFLTIAAVLNIVVAVVSLYIALATIFNWQGVKDIYTDYFMAHGLSDFNITTAEFINYSIFYMFLSFTVNLVFAFCYIYYSRLSYLQYTMRKQKLTYFVFGNLLLSIPNLSVLFVLFALYTKESEKEAVNLNKEFYDLQKDLYYKQLIKTDARLFSMSEKIKKLKEKLNNKEISELEYKNELNEIITTGVH